MSAESPIVSHVANQAYREHVDEMTCEYPGCKRWKVGDGSAHCPDHYGSKAWIPSDGKTPKIFENIERGGTT